MQAMLLEDVITNSMSNTRYFHATLSTPYDVCCTSVFI